MKTRDQLILDALEKLGAVGVNETMTANQITRAASTLTSLLKAFHSKGMPLWKLVELSFSMSLFTAGEAVLGVGQTLVTATRPLKILSATRFDDLANTNINMNVYTRDEFLSIPSPELEAVPTHYYSQPLKDTIIVNLWPLPDTYWQTNGYLKINTHLATTTVTNGTDVLDFPDEWEEAIIYNLADRLAPTYGTPIQERALLRDQAKLALDEALSYSNEEGSIYFQPVNRWGK